jgi:hypothetical protein
MPELELRIRQNRPVAVAYAATRVSGRIRFRYAACAALTLRKLPKVTISPAVRGKSLALALVTRSRVPCAGPISFPSARARVCA